MTDGFHISRGSVPGWLSCAVIVVGIVGYFFYERQSDEYWMAQEEKAFALIHERLAGIEAGIVDVRAEVAHHRGEHATVRHATIERDSTVQPPAAR